MKIINFDLNLNSIYIQEPISACIGYFDGLHLGHQALVNKTIAVAKRDATKTCLITFDPDPNSVLKGCVLQHIVNFEERLKIAEGFGFDYCLILHFTKEMANLSIEEFYTKVLHVLPLKNIVCGFDFHYGQFGKGNYDTLAAQSNHQFNVYKIDSVDYLGEKISSSRIRKAIIEGQVDLASAMLGYQYYLVGKVVHGLNLGHSLGFPTANLAIDDETLLPGNGVYYGLVLLDKPYKAMISIGTNPTVKEHGSRTVEAYILDFNQNIYGQELKIELKEKIREMMCFDSAKDLVAQLKKDELKVRSK